MARQLNADGPRAVPGVQRLVGRESGWNPRATDESSGTYGLVRPDPALPCPALPCPAKKMAPAGPVRKSNPAIRSEWCVNYLNDRYGSPAPVWEFRQAHGCC
ncbi:aggregation-promoting factor C-terminal-like domain-containing protein [Streptomyces diastaticus]